MKLSKYEYFEKMHRLKGWQYLLFLWSTIRWWRGVGGSHTQPLRIFFWITCAICHLITFLSWPKEMKEKSGNLRSSLNPMCIPQSSIIFFPPKSIKAYIIYIHIWQTTPTPDGTSVTRYSKLSPAGYTHFHRVMQF